MSHQTKPVGRWGDMCHQDAQLVDTGFYAFFIKDNGGYAQQLVHLVDVEDEKPAGYGTFFVAFPVGEPGMEADTR